MSVFSKYQRNMSIDWGVDTSEFPFVKCSEMDTDVKIPINGFFITPESGYGEGAIVILKERKELLSLPQRYVDEIKNFMEDPEVVEFTKSGGACIIITEFESKKYKKTGYDVEFTEL